MPDPALYAAIFFVGLLAVAGIAVAMGRGAERLCQLTPVRPAPDRPADPDPYAWEHQEDGGQDGLPPVVTNPGREPL